MKELRFFTSILIASVLCISMCCATAYASNVEATPKRQTSQKKNTKTNKGGNKKRESSAAVKKQEASVHKEIKLTQKQIEENEASVKENLALLNSLDNEIKQQNERVNTLLNQEKRLTTDIASCQLKIDNSRRHLDKLRTHYVSAIKKMRVARKRSNPLAFIFSAKTFYQAWRRMRYLKKFGDWRAGREAEIKEQIELLAKSQAQLAAGKKQLEKNLNAQEEARKVLASKHAAQNTAVKELRTHGEALRKHLARKQAEANDLQARIVTLIAAEQEEARMAEIRRKEQARKAAEEKAAKEREAAAKAAKEKAEKEKAEKEKAEADRKAAEKAEKQNATKKKEKQKTEKKKPTPKKDVSDKKKETPATKPETKQESSGKNYAEARNRRPRNADSSKPAAKATTPAASTATGFAAMRGSLPRPVSGQFNIYSRFGTQSLPDMPDIKFNNPGIDAIVDKGASAQAVYSGSVTGIYVLPGYSTVIIISHGDYYTVYGNIGTPSVKKGDSVKQGQALGKLVSDPDEGGRTTIHFEVWKHREKLNPENWLR